MEQLYVEKAVSDYYSRARKEISSVFPAHAKRVLEVGCGSGATLAWLKETGRAGWVYGVDINERELALAREQGIDGAKCGNVENGFKDIVEDDERFDVILFLDVLEHLYNPWKVVNETKRYLGENGCIIASIPNSQNFRIIVPLIFGRWDYTPCGLLDKTHVRFFTKRTAIKMFLDNGLEIVDNKPIYDQNKLMRVFNWMTLGVFRRFFTMQFLVVAK